MLESSAPVSVPRMALSSLHQILSWHQLPAAACWLHGGLLLDWAEISIACNLVLISLFRGLTYAVLQSCAPA